MGHRMLVVQSKAEETIHVPQQSLPSFGGG